MRRGSFRTRVLVEKGGVMEAIWVTVSFVFGTLAIVAFAMLRMFGGGNWHRH